MKKPIPWEWLKKLTNNMGLKVLALVFSALLWLVCINISDPVERKTFRDLNVTMLHTGVLTAEGKCWDVLDDTDTVTVTVRASRSVLDTISSSDVVATADFEHISYAGTVPISVRVDGYAGSQLSSISTSIDDVKLDIEDQIERQLVLKLVQDGEPAEGYVVSKITAADSNAVRVSGPESLVKQVAQATVNVNVSGLTDNLNIAEDIVLLDGEGRPMRSSRLSKSVNTTQVSVTILKTSDVPLVFSYRGEPAEGYAATGEITANPQTISVAGKAAVLADVNRIQIPESELDITNAQASLQKKLDVRQFLPDGVTLSPVSDFNGMVDVTVVVESIKEQAVLLNVNNIELENIPEGYEMELDEVQRIYVRLKGLSDVLSEINTASLTGTVDVREWMESQNLDSFTDQTITVPVSVELPEGVIQSGTVSAVIHVEDLSDNDDSTREGLE